MLDPLEATCKPSEGRQAPSGSSGSSSNWIYRTAAHGTNALRAWSSSVPSSLIASTVIPPALLSTNLASKPRPCVNRTATRCPFHSLGKYPANAPPLSAYILLASYPYMGPPGLETVKRRQARYKLQVLRELDNKGRLPTARRTPLIFHRVVENKLVGIVRSEVVRTATLRAGREAPTTAASGCLQCPYSPGLRC